MAKAKVETVSGEVIAPFICWRCPQILAQAAGPGTSLRCRRCGAVNRAPTDDQRRQIDPPKDATRPSAQDALGGPAA